MKATLGLAVVATLALAAWAPTATAQTYSCGDIQLVFRNPDLQPGSDGLIHAQGQFFAQFQAIGERANEIEVFGFSFGPVPQQLGADACDAPVLVTSAYILNYRADRDASDGFFIPLVTPLVPDGQYAAAVHAYDGNNNELARFWTLAEVDNCDGGATSRCGGDVEQISRQDKTAPWPIVLPGDGVAMEGHQFTVEFGEELTSYAVFLNGRDITAEMVEWDGRLWDADYVPDYGPAGIGEVVTPPCELPAPVHQCIKYGPAYEWTGRALVGEDVVRVEAVDLAGNRAVKDIHIGSGIEGGAVTSAIPQLNYKVDTLSQQVGVGQSALYKFEIENIGGGTGHPYAEAIVPEGWTYEWQPVHVVVDPGETETQELVVTVPPNAANGIYQVNATLNYRQGGDTTFINQALQVLVGDGPAIGAAAGEEGGETSKASPAPLHLLIVALALMAARRRA
ncbi:MAG: NEW3 domain-containing protein [Candidatus Thermoplasmatota archaeon]